jgi:hypothetical protein
VKFNSSKDHPVVEAALESGEAVTDILMHGEVLAGFPVIGQAINLCKALDAIRDRALAIKLAKFIVNLDSITEEQKHNLKNKISTKAEEAQKVGETIFFVLERVTDLDKPSLLAKIFLAYIDGVVSGEELRRLCQAVDTAFADDLQKLLTADIIPEKSEEPWMQYLVASGLTRLIAGQTWDDSGMLYCEITPLAKTLRNAYSHAQKPVHSA